MIFFKKFTHIHDFPVDIIWVVKQVKLSTSMPKLHIPSHYFYLKPNYSGVGVSSLHKEKYTI